MSRCIFSLTRAVFFVDLRWIFFLTNTDVVLIFKIDRLTRSTRDLIELIDIFNNHKCEFCSLMESIDTLTASGRMFLKIIGIFAEFERENLIERLKLGFERKAKEGYSNASHLISYRWPTEFFPLTLCLLYPFSLMPALDVDSFHMPLSISV